MLTIKNLEKTYANGVHALDDVSLEISNGMFGLLGPNGAGKSTLMRTIATLQAADGGSIEFNGIDVLKQPDQIRRILGYLPQDFGVYPRISAEAMLDHMAILKGIVNTKERRALVAFLLAQTNLDQVKKKANATVSTTCWRRSGKMWWSFSLPILLKMCLTCAPIWPSWTMAGSWPVAGLLT